jgi:hypothetical protein
LCSTRCLAEQFVNTDVVVVVRIAQLLESNKCLFSIATNNSLQHDVLEAFFPAGTFAHGQRSTPFGHKSAAIGMKQWLALGATGRVVDPGVSQPPSAVALTAAPIWQMPMADNVKVMSRNEALKAENFSHKGERSKPKRQVAHERHQLREEKKMHEKVHSLSVEGRAAA